MEDISRELEREIAQTKPKPYKQDRKSRILIVDDFGKMKSGEYLKKLVLILSIASGLFFITSVIFFSLYGGLSSRSGQVKSRLEIAEKKVADLTREKEVLMARLVIQGKEPGVLVAQKTFVPPESAQKPSPKKVVSQKKVTQPAFVKKVKTPPVQPAPNKLVEPQEKKIDAARKASSEAVSEKKEKKMVSIEKFTVIKDGDNGDLLVRFDIRNVSSSPGDVSGRIFTLLKPDNDSEDQWLVVPSASLKNGIPSEHRKGQYFSIAHFKPVKFRIKNKADPDLFKKASIYIFSTQGELMFEKLIDITEAN